MISSIIIAAVITTLIFGFLFQHEYRNKTLIPGDAVAYPLCASLCFCCTFMGSWGTSTIIDNITATPKGQVHVVDLGVVTSLDSDVDWDKSCHDITFKRWEKDGWGDSRCRRIIDAPYNLRSSNLDQTYRANHHLFNDKQDQEYIMTYREQTDGQNVMLSFYPKE